jgi:hypothetical protein
VAFVGQITQQAAKDHQPSCLSWPIVQPRKLARKKLREIVEADLIPTDVTDLEPRREKPMDDVMMKVASGA